eukprot:scaffold10476_cov107-Amphora_coffeaeformis.AAC.1
MSDVLGLMVMPLSTVPLTYRQIRRTASAWGTLGAMEYCAHELTENTHSGRVLLTRYIIIPIAER